MSQQQASIPVSPLRRRRLDDMAMRGLHDEAMCGVPLLRRVHAGDRELRSCPCPGSPSEPMEIRVMAS